jgi:hypothetical protein
VRALGFVSCEGCGAELSTAPDRADWTIAVSLGVLSEVRCPGCAEPEAVARELSDHAVERWQERVRPGLTLGQAEEDLARALEEHGSWAECPDWINDWHEADGWLAVGDGLAFPVCRRVVVSVLIRGGHSPASRRFATDVNGWARRVRRAKERQEVRRWEGKAAKRNRKRDKRWGDEEVVA